MKTCTSPSRVRIPAAGNKHPAWFMGLACLALVPAALAQEIPNSSFELGSLSEAVTPFVAGPQASMISGGWFFGVTSGICKEGVAYAEKLQAEKGTQVAFLQGDGSQINDQAPGTPTCLFGTNITGLIPGEEYEIQWSVASRASDVANGELTVLIADPNNDSSQLILVNRQPVTNKGEWNVLKNSFVASSETVYLNFVHSISDIGSGSVGDETTLIDDITIRKLP